MGSKSGEVKSYFTTSAPSISAELLSNPAEIRPRAVFERLFGASDLDPRQQRYQRSILDVVTGDAQRLASTLGGADKRKLDEYLFSIRDVEKRIQNAERNPVPAIARGLTPPDASVPVEFAEHARIMMDLMTLAFRTDATRVVTLLLALEQSPRAYPDIGIPEAHHGLTTPDGDGTLLDHVMVHLWQRPERRECARSRQSAGCGTLGPDGTCATPMKRRWPTCSWRCSTGWAFQSRR